jgi:hypothetical protein
MSKVRPSVGQLGQPSKGVTGFFQEIAQAGGDSSRHAATAVSSALRRSMRAVTHSADTSAGSAARGRTWRPTVAIRPRRARVKAMPVARNSRDGRHRLRGEPARRHRACRKRPAALGRPVRAGVPVRSTHPTDRSDECATRKSNVRSQPSADGAHARQGSLPTSPALRAFRASGSKGPAHAKAKPPARHTRSKIVYDRLFFACCVPRASPKHRLDCETAYSIISAKTGIVK